jgi:hypothetical protein
MYIENLRKILVWGKFPELIKMRLSKTTDRDNQLDIERLHFMQLLKVGTREAVSPCIIYVFYPVFYPHNSTMAAVIFLFRTCKIRV